MKKYIKNTCKGFEIENIEIVNYVVKNLFNVEEEF